jgi:diguanylate cyclase (GGDEF)-like protein
LAVLLAGQIAEWSGDDWRWVMAGPAIVLLLILVWCWWVLPNGSVLAEANSSQAAVRGGSFDLRGENFLARILELRLGETGYYYLFNSSGTIILHPDRSLVLQPGGPIGRHPLFDRAIQGFEGSGESVSPDGRPVLASFKRLQATDWTLGASYPLNEAYAPVLRLQKYFLPGLAATVLFAIFSVGLLMQRLTVPLLKVTSHVRDLSEGKADLVPLPVATRDEIGTLILAFNRLVEKIEQQKGAIREQKEFAENLVQHSAAPIFVIGADHRVIVWNRACEELTGLGGDEVKGSDGHWRAFYEEPRPCLADFAISGDAEGLSALYEQHIRSGLVQEGLQAEGWRNLRNGSRRYLIFNAAPIRGSQGKIVAAIQTLEDLTLRKEAEQRLEHLAHFDTLTGLPNRTLFFDRLEQGLAAADRYGHELGLLFIDLDGFKVVNDTGGHGAGDGILGQVAQRLKVCVRGCDTVARVGGDEFAVVLGRVTGEAGAQLVAERILEAMSQPLIFQGRPYAIGVSIGISLYPGHGSEADFLVRKADAAMYRVKAQGKNHFAFYQEGIPLAKSWNPGEEAQA